MNSTKEIVDKYLLENFEEIQIKRLNKNIDWEIEAQRVTSGRLPFLNKEYVRGRFKILRKQQELENSYVEGVKNKLDNQSSTSTQKFNYQEKRDSKGNVEIYDVVDRKLTDDELFERYGRDKATWKIVTVWFKDRQDGFLLSVNFAPIKETQQALDNKKIFEKFLENRNLSILQRPKIDLPKLRDEEVTVVINLADLHLGKLVSEHETGERYNLEIAKKRFLECIKVLALRSYTLYGVKKIILSTLGDTLHTDNLKSTTTSGTYVESDTRASKVFSTALELITEAIDICKQFAKEVEFININGNHCELSEQHLGVAIKAFYRNDKQVFIDADPKNRKYRLEGKNLLAWSHGDTNATRLPLTMATEQAELWGKSSYRLMQLGHLHTSKKMVYQSEDEINGVVVRHFSSLSSTDNWHDKNCYVGNVKKGTALIFKDDIIGILAEINHTI